VASAVLVLKVVQVMGRVKLVVASITYTYSGVPVKFICTVPLSRRAMPLMVTGTMFAIVRFTIPPLTEIKAVVPGSAYGRSCNAERPRAGNAAAGLLDDSCMCQCPIVNHLR